MPKLFYDPDAIADDNIGEVGTHLVVGLPLGLGKANHIVNALYKRAAADRAIDLTFFSALTLEKPKPKSFYRALREMPPEQLARIQMMPVSFTNQLHGDEDIKRRARIDARFVNNAMMATLMGAVISDGLEDGQVGSGVGGQYNFVPDAVQRSSRCSAEPGP
jgi:hypothetical protein